MAQGEYPFFLRELNKTVSPGATNDVESISFCRLGLSHGSFQVCVSDQEQAARLLGHAQGRQSHAPRPWSRADATPIMLRCLQTLPLHPTTFACEGFRVVRPWRRRSRG